jgi:formamidopyrimidine-DNA glycosylase
MPELPEVETLRRQLAAHVTNRVIERVTIVDAAKLGAAPPVAGRRVTGLGRQGKFLVLNLERGEALTVHLRMSGRLCWRAERDATLAPHTRFTILFASGRLDLIDPRRFATLRYGPPPAPTTALDPLAPHKPAHLAALARGRRLPVKSFLMDQHRLAGIGNIYACEILNAAGIDPWRAAGSLGLKEWSAVGKAMRAVLTRAVADRGTTRSDWRDAGGEPGAYQHRLRVYNRAGEPCPRCRTAIRRLPLAGRGTYFCPSCQQ